jgi:hypothetical protein
MPEVRHVRFEYCISLLFLTWHRESEIISLMPGQRAWIASLPYCVISLFLGWWGIPWGLLLTPAILYRNLCGGLNASERDDSQSPVGSDWSGSAVSSS